MTNQDIINKLIDFSKWITDNGYVHKTLNKTIVWYKPSQYPRVYLNNEQLIEQFYECTHL
jgi:hypothetical protein